MAGGTGELNGVLDLARECWQRASGQTEHPDYTSAQDFVTAAAEALGHKLVAQFLYAQTDELAAALGVTRLKPVIAEPTAPSKLTSAVSIMRTCCYIIHSDQGSLFRFVWLRPRQLIERRPVYLPTDL